MSDMLDGRAHGAGERAAGEALRRFLLGVKRRRRSFEVMPVSGERLVLAERLVAERLGDAGDSFTIGGGETDINGINLRKTGEPFNMSDMDGRAQTALDLDPATFASETGTAVNFKRC